MTKTQPKKHFQIQRMFGLAKDKAAAAGMDTKEYLEQLADQVTLGETSSLKPLTFEQANDMITVLGGDPFRAYGNSKRNENYKKQQAGIKTIETDAHLKLIDEYAAKLGWDADRLRGFCNRQIKKDVPTTTAEGNSVLEGLKAMANRAGNVAQFPKAAAKTAEPTFRRVA